MSTGIADFADRVFEMVTLLEDRIEKVENKLRIANMNIGRLRVRLKPAKVTAFQPEAIKPKHYAQGEMDKITVAVCREFGYAPEDVCGRARFQSLMRPRHTIMFLARERGVSMPDIGRFFKFHHTSVMYAVDRVTDLSKTDSAFMGRLEKLRAEIL